MLKKQTFISSLSLFLVLFFAYAEKAISYHLNPVVTTINFKQLPAFIRYVHQEFPAIRCISLSVVQPIGRAWANKKIVPRYGRISPYVKEALKLARDFSLVINNPFCGLPFCQGGWDEYLDQCVEYCENRFKIKDKKGKHRAKIKAPQCRYCNSIYLAMVFGWNMQLSIR
jgi:hypothetical protein